MNIITMASVDADIIMITIITTTSMITTASVDADIIMITTIMTTSMNIIITTVSVDADIIMTITMQMMYLQAGAKGIVAAAEGEWFHFDLVPEETEIRRGAADFTGRICVIGADLKEDAIKELFHVA